MGRPRTGSAYRHGDHWDIRLTLPDGTRSTPVCQPPEMTKEQARAKAHRGTELATATGAVKNSKTNGTVPPGETLTAYVKRWCADRERRGNTSVNDDRGRLSKWVLPFLDAHADTPMTNIPKIEVEKFVEHIDNRVADDDLSWRTARNVWAVVSKLFDDATNAKTLSLRVLKANPALGVRGPDKGTKKSKVYVFPSEFLQLVSCVKIPIRWRRLYALTTYLYARAAEIRGLDWADVDLEHGLVFIHRTLDDEGKIDSTKGDASRRFRLEPELIPMLRAMHKECGGEGRVFDPLPSEKHLAPMLRRDLQRAGVKRAELFVNDKTRKWMTFHDLRSTGLTWMAIRGDEPLAIKQRAGHRSFDTTLGYIREAVPLREGFGDVFPALPTEIISSGISSERLGRNGHVYKTKG